MAVRHYSQAQIWPDDNVDAVRTSISDESHWVEIRSDGVRDFINILIKGATADDIDAICAKINAAITNAKARAADEREALKQAAQ